MAKRRFAVLRPDDPAKAIAAGLDLVGQRHATQAFDAILTEQPYTFVGFIELPAEVLVDRAGTPVGTLRPGDSFVSPEAFGG